MTKPHRRDSERERDALIGLIASEDALCAQVDPDLFFPELVRQRGKQGSRATAAQAKRMCHRCPIEAACLAAALERREPHGVWGGMTEFERSRLLRRRNTTSPQKAVA